MSRTLIKISIALLILTYVTSCFTVKKTTVWYPPSGEYAFAEYYITYDGSTIEGTPPPGIRIDGPTYTFDKQSGEVNSYMEANFGKDTVAFVLGFGLIRRGTEGGGISSQLIGINRLPYSYRKISLITVSSDDICFKFEDEVISLRKGDFWEKSYESLDTIPSYQGKAVIQRSVTHQIHFYGILSKEILTFP